MAWSNGVSLVFLVYSCYSLVKLIYVTDNSVYLFCFIVIC